MKLSKNQSGILHIAAILAVILLGIIGYTGWRVYSANMKIKPAVTTTSTPSVKKEEPKKSSIAEGFVEYENKDLGFKFAYPKEWGTTAAEAQDNTKFGGKGQLNTVKFSNKKEALLYFNTADYDAFPGGGCGLSRRVIVKKYDSSKPVENSKVLKGANVDVLFQEGKYYNDNSDHTDCIVTGYVDIATFNITKDANYHAAQLRYEYEKERNSAEQEVFLSVIKTISIN